jgi:tRNA(Ile)-lysidine synthase
VYEVRYFFVTARTGYSPGGQSTGYEILVNSMGSSKKRSNKIERKILRTVRDTIAGYKMFAAGDSVLMAVSGGPDSVTLAHILHTIAGEYPIRLALAHLNHGLRGAASERDAEFVAALAGRLDLPFFIEKKDVRAVQQRRRLSPEEAARQVRYAFYDAVASKNGFNKIALGHHSDDNAELVLMNLLRGTGPLGLSGIAPVRQHKIVRPIIRLKRSDILNYVSVKNIAFVTDASNTDQAYRRNQIRHHLIPELKKSYNPAIVASLNRLGEILQAEDRWMDEALEPAFDECLIGRSSHHISLSIPGINAVDLAAKRRIIRKAIFRVKHNLRRITFSHVDAVIGLAKQGPTCGSLDLPGGIRVIKDKAALLIEKEIRQATAPVVEYRYTIAGEGITSIKEAGAAIKIAQIETAKVPDFDKAGKHQAFFDRDCMQFPLVVRNLRPGDRFSPLGMEGTQKLKKFFSNNKIPVRQRQNCPLVLSENKIIWVAGHRIDNSVKLGPQTRRVLVAELLLA